MSTITSDMKINHFMWTEIQNLVFVVTNALLSHTVNESVFSYLSQSVAI